MFIQECGASRVLAIP